MERSPTYPFCGELCLVLGKILFQITVMIIKARFVLYYSCC